ncbi:GNAT family N-acetyltransferase [Arthrobacter sp. ISL-48]|uniref:GNAT family N-acetyltransferase n=1 Tax=Arthrobacter sp. ISL-48 TaxID=2819110 RepID=UPI001BEA18CA|nr:GNAT family protein [Arthrobacter sp. ISL-48]MBT2533803.1 GNAT family N-acetyltransferase [Arthrobacter sp. ISL-48]
MSPSPDVALVDVNEAILEQLLVLAVEDASPDEVTPPLGTGPGWDAERTAWFYAYHRAAVGLDGPAQEKSWAVLCDGKVAGSIRLKRTASPDNAGEASAETGIWLGRHHRGRGVGTAALRLVLEEARGAGMERVVASTMAGNLGARGILASVGAVLMFEGDGTVRAGVDL